MTLPDLESRMLSGDRFTYREMCIARNGFHGDPGSVVAKLVKRLRNAGKIEYRRENGKFSWRAK